MTGSGHHVPLKSTNLFCSQPPGRGVWHDRRRFDGVWRGRQKLLLAREINFGVLSLRQMKRVWSGVHCWLAWLRETLTQGQDWRLRRTAPPGVGE